MKKVKLSKPVQSFGETISEVTLREPTVKDLMVFDKATGDIGKMVAMVCSLSSLEEPCVHEMSAKDFQKISEVVEGFLDDSPATGGK